MNILFLANCVSQYGANLSMVDLIIKLINHGQQAYVALPYNGPIERILREKKIKYCIIPYNMCAHYQKQYSFRQKADMYLKNRLLLQETKKYIDKWNIDIIHSNASNLDFGQLVANKYGIPHVWHVREMLYNDYQLTYDFGQLTSFLMKQADKIICISEFIRKTRGIKGRNICVIPDGLDLDKYYIENKSLFGDREKIELLFAGNMNESKGAIDAIRATEILVRKYKMNVHLTLAGDESEYIRKCFRYINARKEYMDFVGFQSDLTELRKRADIVFMCSRSEGLGRVTLESMLGKCLVIGAKAGATPELIQDGVTGYLYEVGNVYQLAQITRNAINNTDKSRKIIDTAQNFVLDKFGSNAYAEKIITIYRESIRKRRRFL